VEGTFRKIKAEVTSEGQAGKGKKDRKEKKEGVTPLQFLTEERCLRKDLSRR